MENCWSNAMKIMPLFARWGCLIWLIVCQLNAFGVLTEFTHFEHQNMIDARAGGMGGPTLPCPTHWPAVIIILQVWHLLIINGPPNRTIFFGPRNLPTQVLAITFHMNLALKPPPHHLLVCFKTMMILTLCFRSLFQNQKPTIRTTINPLHLHKG